MFTPVDPLRVVLADPPWSFKTFSDKGHGRSPQAHYDTMSLDEIKAIPVKDWIADDAVLFLWVIDPMLPQALEVMDAWGFKMTTPAFYWAKMNKSVDLDALVDGKTRRDVIQKDFFTGLGYYTRANVEQCWLGTRKKKPKRKHKDVKKLIVSPRREHSRKPDEVYNRIERLFDGPYAELFARSTRPGWENPFGNQTGLFDQGSVDTRRIPSDLTVKHDETLHNG